MPFACSEVLNGVPDGPTAGNPQSPTKHTSSNKTSFYLVSSDDRRDNSEVFPENSKVFLRNSEVLLKATNLPNDVSETCSEDDSKATVKQPCAGKHVINGDGLNHVYVRSFSSTCSHNLLPFTPGYDKFTFRSIKFKGFLLSDKNAREIEYIFSHAHHLTSIGFTDCDIQPGVFKNRLKSINKITQIALRGNFICQEDMDHLAANLSEELKYLDLSHNLSHEGKSLVSFPVASVERFKHLKTIHFLTERHLEKERCATLDKNNQNDVDLVSNILLFNPIELDIIGDNMVNVFLAALPSLPKALETKYLTVGSFWGNEIDCSKFMLMREYLPNLEKLQFFSYGHFTPEQVVVWMPSLDYVKFLIFKCGRTTHYYDKRGKNWYQLPSNVLKFRLAIINLGEKLHIWDKGQIRDRKLKYRG